MEQIVKLCKNNLMINWYSEKIAEELKYTESTSEILKVAEEKIKYKIKTH